MSAYRAAVAFAVFCVAVPAVMAVLHFVFHLLPR